MKATRRILTVVLGVLAVAAVCPAQESLFLDHTGGLETAILSQPGVDRSLPVDIDLGPLEDGDDATNPDPEGRVVLLNLFDDVLLVARLERVERWGSGSTWAGPLEGQTGGDAVITVDDGVVSGRVEAPGATYSVRWDGARHVVEERLAGARTAPTDSGERSVAKESEASAMPDGADLPEPPVERAEVPEKTPNPGNDEGLLRASVRPSSDDVALGFGVVRSRPIRIDLGQLPGADGRSLRRSGEQALRLNLFDDVELTARLGRGEKLEKGMAWTGRLEGEPLSSVSIVVHDGIVSGSVNGQAGSYRIRWDGTGQIVEEVDYDRFPERDDCAEEYPGDPFVADAPDRSLLLEDASSDDGSLIDVMVVYTPAARIAEGGTSQMEALINLAVLETNTSYANSGVIQRIRLVHTAEVALTETPGSGGWSTDLSRLWNPSDGHIDNVHALRDTYKADMVSLFGTGYTAAGNCGVAYLMPGNDPGFASAAFSVVDRTCATGYYSFGHEMGHNQGLNHARVDFTGTGAYPYSYGYKWPGYRSVMAYSPGTRVPYYSNPDISHSGYPTGIAETEFDSAHNALSLNQTRMTVANWRHSGPTAADLIVVAPNGGESWAAGTQQVLNWSSTSLTASEIQVHLTDGVDTVLMGTVPSDWTGALWNVPSWIGSDWRIKLCAVNEATPAQRSMDGGSAHTCEVSDTSDAPFAITTP